MLKVVRNRISSGKLRKMAKVAIPQLYLPLIMKRSDESMITKSVSCFLGQPVWNKRKS